MTALFLIAAWLGTPSWATSEKKNCKLAVRTSFVSGKKRVEVDEISVGSREECKQEAKLREINRRPREIASIKVTFGFKSGAAD